MGDERKALPWAPTDEQVKVSSYSHIRDSPFEDEDGTQELEASMEDGSPLYLKMPRAGDDQYVTTGVEDYQALRNLTEIDLQDEAWEPASAESVSDIPTPTYDEMEELRDKYEERLEAAESEAEERAVRREMWDEAEDWLE